MIRNNNPQSIDLEVVKVLLVEARATTQEDLVMVLLMQAPREMDKEDSPLVCSMEANSMVNSMILVTSIRIKMRISFSWTKLSSYQEVKPRKS